MHCKAIVSIFRFPGQLKSGRSLTTIRFGSDRPVRRLPTISSCSRSFPTTASFPPSCKGYSLEIPSSDKFQDPKEDTKTRSEQNSKSSRNSNESGSRQSLDSLFYALGMMYFLNKEKGENLLSIWSRIVVMKGLFENILGLWGFMEKSLQKGFNKAFLEWVNKCKGKSDANEKIMILLEEIKTMKKGEAEAEAEAMAEASKTTGWWGEIKSWFGH